MTIGLMLLGMFALVLINVPIAVALGVVAIAAIWIVQGTYMLPNVALVMFQGATDFPLLAVPLFIFAGGIMNASTISRRLINLATAMLGFIRGGLAMVTVGASMFFAEISGSAVADVAALGTLLIPAMKSRGYSKEFAAAISSSSASLAIIIPPVDPDDPLRRDGAGIGGEDVRRRVHSRHPRRAVADGPVLLLRVEERLPGRAAFLARAS